MRPQIIKQLKVLTHDTGRSGCYLLLGFIPFGSIVLLIFFIEDSQQTTNQYGPSPKYVIIQGDPLMNNSMAISVAGIPNVNPNPAFVQGYVQPNPYPYPVQQYVQYPPQNIPIPQQQNLYEGKENSQPEKYDLISKLREKDNQIRVLDEELNRLRAEDKGRGWGTTHQSELSTM